MQRIMDVRGTDLNRRNFKKAKCGPSRTVGSGQGARGEGGGGGRLAWPTAWQVLDVGQGESDAASLRWHPSWRCGGALHDLSTRFRKWKLGPRCFSGFAGFLFWAAASGSRRPGGGICAYCCSFLCGFRAWIGETIRSVQKTPSVVSNPDRSPEAIRAGFHAIHDT